ncbi:helix-turn-helix domain-containing protein [Chryseobacterium manosquense]|uniref:Helix-turn-helix domain-containing protein n=1 Tax=Chryseobacterium manosquense TaxID=2754694 RepID=A0A7H1DXG0_9FLAO|nr:helix-turn-helix domain-containing protein [Chryseobacterium manosquense]QNS41668.1 helix-turn-helix domain-containing protein [Chryseobacterium manosquense]
MAIAVLTKEDLKDFKKELLEDIKNLFHSKVSGQKQWLRSAEVRALLNISSGTLQNLRINGTLHYSKVGGTIFYAFQDIEKLMHTNNRSL